MQSVNAALQAELDKGQVEPIVLLDLYEFYASDYIPGISGFDPADAIETFAAEEVTWDGIAYRREAISRGDIVKSYGEKINSVTLAFSNISRYLATFAQTQQIEGMWVAIRCVSPNVESDYTMLMTGRAEKPSDIDKKTFTLAVKPDFGNVNITVPPNKFEADDPEGRLPSDPLFEGMPFTSLSVSLTFPRVEQSTSFLGRLFGRRRTVSATQQHSSVDGTPYGSVIPETFGRVQLKLIIFNAVDKGSHVGYLAAACRGPVFSVTQIKSLSEGLSDPICSFANPPAPAVVHLGDPGGTGTNNGNTCQADLARGLFFSHLAYVEGASAGIENGQLVALALDEEDAAPDLAAIVMGRLVPLRNSSGVYGAEGWSNNPVDILRFLLTDPQWGNINPAFMEDAAFHRAALHCDFPLIDDSGSEVITIPSAEVPVAGTAFTRFLSTGLYTPRHFLYYDLGDNSIVPELEDGPYVGIDSGDPVPDPHDTTDPAFVSQKPLIARYRANFPVTEEIRLTDLVHKILLPTFKGYLKVNKFGRYEPHSEQPADSTRIRNGLTVGATSIPVLNVTPWITGPELLKGRIRLGFLESITSEVRTPSVAQYSTSGNSVTLSASKTGGVTVSASGATFSGGSTSVPATGSITIGGTPAAGNTITATIDGIAITYTLNADDTTSTAAAMLVHYINGNQRLNKYIRASWIVGSPDLVSLTCLHGTLTVPALLFAHDGPIADPTSAPTIAAAASGILGAGTYRVAYSNIRATGSTALTPVASVVLTANQKINVSGLPAFPAGITSRDFYVSEKPNSVNLRYLTTRTDAADFAINSLPEVESAMPPSYNSTAEELLRVCKSFATNSQDVYPAWRASSAVILNDVYLPTTLNGHKYKVTTAGTTAASEPSWPTGAGATVASGSAVFTEFGSTVLAQAGLTRSNVIKDSYKFPLGSRQPTINQIKGSFRSAKDDFALQPFTINDREHQAYVKKKYPLEVDLSAVDNFNQTKRLGNFLLSKYREGDWFVSLGAGPNCLVLEEGDVICSSDDAGGLINVVTRIEELAIKPNHDVVITQSRKYSTRMFSDDVGAHRIPLPSTLRFAVTKNSLVEFIDTPAVRPSDFDRLGFQVAVSHNLDIEGDWRGWTLWVDFGDGYQLLTEGDVPAMIGHATTTLGTVSDISVFDTVNSVTLQFNFADTGVFSNSTEADLLIDPYRSLFLVGSEYLQAATIVDNGGRSITISDLWRGRFGTDSDELIHTSADRVVFINGAEKFVEMGVSHLNVPLNYKAVTTNQDVADATPVSFTWTGRSLVPAKASGIVVHRDTKAFSGGLANQIQINIPTRDHEVGETVKYWVDVYSATAGPVFTVDDATDVFTSTSHDLNDGDSPALSTTGTLPRPLHKINHYYVRDATTHTFKLAASPDGPAIDILDTGSGTHKFTKRMRHIPVVNFGAFNPALITVFTPDTTPPVGDGVWHHGTTSGSGGWDSTITTEWTARNTVFGNGPGATGGGINAAALALITEPGAEIEFTLGTVSYSPGSSTLAFLASPEFDLEDDAIIYRVMDFALFTDGSLPPESKTASRRWKLTIYERATPGGSLDLVYTDDDLELPGMRYRMQLSGTELRYYRDYGGPNSELLYRSTVPLILPLRPRFEVATVHALRNIKIGGLPDCVTTYPDTDMIADFGTQPTTVRFRVYEERVVAGVSFFGDATDFIT